MKPRLRIYFTDFWTNFNPVDNLFYHLLSKKYTLELDSREPDILFYSLFGTKFHRYDCKRVCFIGENVRPDMEECDYSFCFDHSDHPRIYRLPLYALFTDHGTVYDLLQKRDPEEIMQEKTKFCNFIYSNPGQERRNKFFKKLSKYKKVDSGGRFMRNIDYPIIDKIDFIRDYKFTIAFENSSYPGYTTEKIFEPMLVDSMPLYWGNPLVDKDFNTESFVNLHDFSSDEEAIERIIEIDKNDDLWYNYLKQPYFPGNELNEFVDNDKILEKLQFIVERDITPVATKSPVFSGNKLRSSAALFRYDLKYHSERYLNKVRNFKISKLKIKIRKIMEK